MAYENKLLDCEVYASTITDFGKTKFSLRLTDPCNTYGEYVSLEVKMTKQELEEFIFALCKIREKL